MSLHVSPLGSPAVPTPSAGAAPVAAHTPVATSRHDTIAPPVAHLSLPKSPPPRDPVDGTPETLAAAALLGGAALTADIGLAGTGAALRSASSYLARLASGIVRCVSDPVKTGEHIAEGVVGGAAWAGAAAGVTALADAARAHVSSSHATPR